MNFEVKTTHPNIMMVAPQGSGKSVLLDAFMKKYGHMYDKMYYFCPTMWDFRKKYPNLVKVSSFNEKTLSAFVDGMSTLTQNYHKARIAAKKSGDRPPKKKRYLLIMDDFLGCIKTTNHPVFRKLASHSRHFNLTCIYLVQYFSASIHVGLRKQMNYYFVFDGLTESDWEHITGCLPVSCEYRGNASKLEADLAEMNMPPYSFVGIKTRGKDAGIEFFKPIVNGRFKLVPLRRSVRPHARTKMYLVGDQWYRAPMSDTHTAPGDPHLQETYADIPG
jgi:hypothetical protein